MSVSEPVNLLSLDGGGIRGVSELVILNEVMKRVQQKGRLKKLPKPCDHFHLIGGTSTGGLLAIMLGRLDMDTEEAIQAYDDFACKIFDRKFYSFRRISLTSRYSTKAFENTINTLVQERGRGVLMRETKQGKTKGHAFVCTMPELRHRETVCLRTYTVADDKHTGCLIYEAARATTAATTYFKPMSIRDNQGNEQNFVDAALGTNNPISVLWDEALGLFGKNRRLGCVVSLGTGSRHVEMDPGRTAILGPFKLLTSAVKVMKEIGTDSERDHQRWKAKFEEFENTYFRLNVDGGAQGIDLSNWKKIKQLKERTHKYLQDPEVKTLIDRLADVLLHNKTSGLNLSHGTGLHKENVIPAEPNFTRRGKSSNLFTGRTRILERLDKHFGPRAAGDQSRREFQLRGTGGMGKTQIALKFTERNDSRFHIIWVDATDASTAEQSFLKTAQSIFGSEERAAPVQDVINWLEKTDEEWLIVFDNAPESGLEKYLPDGDRGNILYTSRHHNLQPRLRPECVETVEEMDMHESVDVLLLSAQKPITVVENREMAKPIVQALGCLPLAIDQAGAYIHMAPCPLDSYLDLLKEQEGVLLQNPRFQGGDGNRHIAVFATFDISYRAIRAVSERKDDHDRDTDAKFALQLLNLICFYHHEGYFSAIFERAAKLRFRTGRHEVFPLRADGQDLDHFVLASEPDNSSTESGGSEWLFDDYFRGISLLNQFSLLRLDGENHYTNMHIIVHDWARNRMSKEEQLAWGLAARCILMESIGPIADPDKITHRREIMPHLEICRRHANTEHPDPGLESEYQANMARVFRQAGRLKAAERALLKALKSRKIEFGLLDPAPFIAMSELAALYLDQGRITESREMLLEVLDRRMLYRKESKWKADMEKAREKDPKASDATPRDVVNQETESISEVEDPLDDAGLRKDTDRLFTVLSHEDNLPAMKEIGEKLLSWRERNLGVESHEARAMRRHLSKIPGGSGEEDLDLTIQQAIAEFDDAKAQFGPIHWRTIDAEQRFAEALMRDGLVQTAGRVLWHVQEWNKLQFGVNTQQHCDALGKLANVITGRERAYDAGSIHDAVLHHNRARLGDLHPTTLRSMQDLANSFFFRADYAKAAELMQECLRGREATLGPHHRMTQLTAHRVRQFRYYEEALPDYLKAGLQNKAIVANRDALGDLAPRWMREWEPASVEELMRAHLERGAVVRAYKMRCVEVDGFPFYEFIPTREISWD